MIPKVYEAALVLKDSGDDGQIPTVEFLECFDAVSDLIGELGTLFSFVTKDVNGKIETLRKHHQERGPENGETLRHMIEYEQANDLIQPRSKASSSRQLVRLHRALDFIRRFLKLLAESDDSDSTAAMADEAYSHSLKPHHTWLVQKTVGLALRTLPSRTKLFERILHEPDGRTATIENILEAHEVLDRLFDSVFELLNSRDLMDLP